MAITESTNCLPSVYEDFTQQQIDEEKERVFQATQIERDWMLDSGSKPFVDTFEILNGYSCGELARIDTGLGYQARPTLRLWEPDRDNPDHEYFYSPPFLNIKAARYLGHIAHSWLRDFGGHYELSVTSLVRSQEYQRVLAQKHGKITIDPQLGQSSHVFGYAFDIDGTGLYRISDPYSQTRRSINPSSSGYEEYQPSIKLSRDILRSILRPLMQEGSINYVEELEGTRQHVFHICVNPDA